MVFRLATVLSLLALAWRLTYVRFRDEVIRRGAQAGSLTRGAYFRWLGERVGSLTKPVGWQGLVAALRYFSAFYPSSFLRVSFTGLAASLGYLALSGFAFALFSPRGLFGIPLLLHVMAGGIFAVGQAILLIFRAKEYTSVFGIFTSGHQSLSFLLETFSRPLRRSLLFWVFHVAGLVLIATALFSMLPYFSHETQLAIAATHRWSALVALLSGIAFFDAGLPRKEG
jgi:hypothetical protein